MQIQDINKGKLRIEVLSSSGQIPIPDATIEISYTGDPDSALENITTDATGQTETIDLGAPPVEYSLSPGDNQPYSEYTLKIRAKGYESFTVTGVQILPDETALQQVRLIPTDVPGEFETPSVIEGHTLWESYPAKIPESEIKPVNETGEIVLSRVVIPEYIIVHDGSPRDSTASDYYIKYRDYIKNVASSEIYSTWPDAAIRANILAIMSFTLNRVYTEWYRNKGYDFTITSSTAYDQKWTKDRNIFEDISLVVDEIFADYLSRPNVRQPILTQYCDGKRVTCPNWMSQWGSKDLADKGYSTIDILRNYYGDSIYINTAPEISGVPASWPGYTLTEGASGDKILQLQEELNVIAGAYPLIPKIAEDGIYGPKTAEAVKTFQGIFGLPKTGEVDYSTWYKISEIYVGVSRIAELS